MPIKSLVKRIIYGHKVDSKRYIDYLRSKGMEIGEDVTIYAPTKTMTLFPVFGWGGASTAVRSGTGVISLPRPNVAVRG